MRFKADACSERMVAGLGDHLFVWCLATASHSRKTGLASHLLDFIKAEVRYASAHWRSDSLSGSNKAHKQSLPIALTTSQAKNVEFYRHVGFELAKEERVADLDGADVVERLMLKRAMPDEAARPHTAQYTK